jgi:GNAT superfamily N-acetyltransferase
MLLSKVRKPRQKFRGFGPKARSLQFNQKLAEGTERENIPDVINERDLEKQNITGKCISGTGTFSFHVVKCDADHVCAADAILNKAMSPIIAEEFIEKLQRLLLRSTTLFVATADTNFKDIKENDVVGVVGLCEDEIPAAISGLYVLPAAIRQGVGMKLLQAVESRAFFHFQNFQKSKTSPVCLTSVHTPISNAAFFQKCGYERSTIIVPVGKGLRAYVKRICSASNITLGA